MALHSWTSVASFIYLESPVGVGYTYSTNDNDYNCNDDSTATDNLNFLLAFFAQAPNYKTLPFFVFGESYAGVYVPTLAAKIVNSNAAGTNAKINLVGTGTGNPVTNTQSESTLNSWVPFTYGHGLMSPSLHAKIQSSCASNPNGWDCGTYVNQANQAYQNINPYWVDGACFNGAQFNERIVSALFPPNDPINRARMMFRALEQVPCIDSDNAQNYLNRAAARSALHVQDIKWSICSNSLNYSPSGQSMLPNYQLFLKNNIRVLVYSGDADSVVPWTGTSKWVTQELNLGTPKSDWVPWNYDDGENGPQVGGWKTTYDVGLTFTTIRGSGHMIAQFTPARSLHMFKNFIQNKPL